VGTIPIFSFSALKVFAEYGYKKTTLADIAKSSI